MSEGLWFYLSHKLSSKKGKQSSSNCLEQRILQLGRPNCKTNWTSVHVWQRMTCNHGFREQEACRSQSYTMCDKVHPSKECRRFSVSHLIQIVLRKVFLPKHMKISKSGIELHHWGNRRYSIQHQTIKYCQLKLSRSIYRIPDVWSAVWYWKQ